MNERDLRPGLVRNRLDAMRQLLADLDQLGEPSAVTLADQRFTRHVAERVVSALTDLAVGTNSHLCATQGGVVPADAADTFDALVERGVLDQRLGAALRGSVGLRNVIVHEYTSVDLAVLAASLPLARRHYAEYVVAVASWLDDRLS